MGNVESEQVDSNKTMPATPTDDNQSQSNPPAPAAQKPTRHAHHGKRKTHKNSTHSEDNHDVPESSEPPKKTKKHREKLSKKSLKSVPVYSKGPKHVKGHSQRHSHKPPRPKAYKPLPDNILAQFGLAQLKSEDLDENEISPTPVEVQFGPMTQGGHEIPLEEPLQSFQGATDKTDPQSESVDDFGFHVTQKEKHIHFNQGDISASTILQDEANENTSSETEILRKSLITTGTPDDYVNSFLKSFRFFYYLLGVWGLFPWAPHVNEDTKEVRMEWRACTVRSAWFYMTSALSLVLWILMIVNVWEVLFIQHMKGRDQTTTEILEKALFERNLVHLFQFLVTQTLALVVRFLIFHRHLEIEKLFNLTIQFTARAKMHLNKGAYKNAATLMPFYCISSGAVLTQTFYKPTATTTGGPIIAFMCIGRLFLPHDYMKDAENFPHSSLRMAMSVGGVVIIYIILLGFFLLYYFFLWVLKIYRNAWSQWNERVKLFVCSGEHYRNPEHRLSYAFLFDDHMDLVQINQLINNMFDIIIEGFAVVFAVISCFQNQVAIKAYLDEDNPLTENEIGLYFVRPNDQYPNISLSLLNIIHFVVLMLACAWYEDDANEGYSIMRDKVFLHGLQTHTQVRFCMTMLQSYTGPVKLRIEGGGYFAFGRQNLTAGLLFVLTTTLVIYQLAPKWDTNTELWHHQHEVIGKFLQRLEGLPPDHYKVHVPLYNTGKQRLSSQDEFWQDFLPRDELDLGENSH